MTKGTQERKIRMDDTGWERLTVLANALVQPSEMPLGAKPNDNRVAQLIRMIGSGEIVLTKLGKKPEG